MHEAWTVEEVERRLAHLSARYPDRFSEAQWQEIREEVEQLVQAAGTLRKRPLANGDEPDTVFVP